MEEREMWAVIPAEMTQAAAENRETAGTRAVA